MHNRKHIIVKVWFYWVFYFLKKFRKGLVFFFQYKCVPLCRLQTTMRSVCCLLLWKDRGSYIIVRNTAVQLPAWKTKGWPPGSGESLVVWKIWLLEENVSMKHQNYSSCKELFECYRLQNVSTLSCNTGFWNNVQMCKLSPRKGNPPYCVYFLHSFVAMCWAGNCKAVFLEACQSRN